MRPLSGVVFLQLCGPRLLVAGPWLLGLGGLASSGLGDGGVVLLCGGGPAGWDGVSSV